MPLPALPPNSTNRLFLDYTTGRNQHICIIRCGDAVNSTEALEYVLPVFQALQPVMVQSWTPLGARWQEAGSIITLPVPLTVDWEAFDGNGPETVPATAEPLQWNFVGRGIATGRLVRFGVFGLAVAVPDSYRYTGSGITAAFSNALTALAGIVGDVFITIGGDNATWKPYVNVQYNSYWETEARG